MNAADKAVLDAWRDGGYNDSLDALHGVARRVDVPFSDSALYWLANAAIDIDVGSSPEQSLCYAFNDPWPWKTDPELLVDAEMLLDATAPGGGR